MKRTKWLSLALALALGLGAFGGPRAAAADTASSLQTRLGQLENEEKELKRKAAETRKNLDEQSRHKENLDKQIRNLTQQLNLLDDELERLGGVIADKDKAIGDAQRQMETKETALRDTRDKLEEKLRGLSKRGKSSPLQMLLHADNYAAYLVKSKALERISEKDQRDMDEMDAALAALKREKEGLEDARRQVAGQKADTAALKRKADGKKAELNTQYAEANRVIKAMEQDKTAMEKRMKEIQRMQADLDKRIAELNKAPSQAGSYKAGKMYWPVPAVHSLSDVFRPRWGKQHKGIDIANHPTIKVYGQNIVAAADGVVLQAWTRDTRGGGYGYHVIVDHGYDSRGKRITTMYAHMSKVLVTTGQRVTGGKTVLGRVGDTGDVQGPHLHFEVRENNVAVDPIKNGYVKP